MRKAQVVKELADGGDIAIEKPEGKKRVYKSRAKLSTKINRALAAKDAEDKAYGEQSGGPRRLNGKSNVYAFPNTPGVDKPGYRRALARVENRMEILIVNQKNLEKFPMKKAR